MRDTHYSRTNTTWFLVSKALKSWRMLAWFSWFITSISFSTISCQTRKSSTVHFCSPSPFLKGRQWSKGSSTYPLFGSSGTDDLGCQSKPGFNLCAFVYFAEPTTKITEQSFNLCAFFCTYECIIVMAILQSCIKTPYSINGYMIDLLQYVYSKVSYKINIFRFWAHPPSTSRVWMLKSDGGLVFRDTHRCEKGAGFGGTSSMSCRRNTCVSLFCMILQFTHTVFYTLPTV